MPDLWDRQRLGLDGQFVEEGGELEPVLWYGRFRDYLTLGADRSFTEACERWRVLQGRKRLGAASGAWLRIARKWHWQDRAEAWDAEQLRLRWDEDRERYDRMVRRHADLGRGMQTAAARGLQHIAAKAERDPDSLTASEAVRLAEAGIKAERTAEGLPSELIGILTDLMRMDEDELREYNARLATQMGAVADDDAAEGTEPEAD